MSSIVSFFTLNIITSVVEGFAGQLSNGGLISFGEFDDAAYNLFQLIIFILMAVFGGLSGSFFNALNAK
jgi:chloride channel 7